MHCRDIEDLFIFFLDVLGGGACDFWSWVSQCCRAWCIAANHAFGRPRIVELLCFCVTVSALPLSKWSCDEHVSKFFGGYLLSDAALVKYVMPDSLQPSFHAHDLAFMRFPASKWPLMHHGRMYSCGCHCWTFLAGWPVMFAAALVNNIVTDALQPSMHAHDLAFMRFRALGVNKP
jgi:hypothetical protein